MLPKRQDSTKSVHSGFQGYVIQDAINNRTAEFWHKGANMIIQNPDKLLNISKELEPCTMRAQKHPGGK